MFKTPSHTRTAGFTLVELVLALVVIGVISAFMLSISSSVNNFSKLATTKVRMQNIAKQARQYFLAHRKQALAAPDDRVPVQSGALNLEGKYRLDGWGQFFRYLLSDNTDPQKITGFLLNGNSVHLGAVIISRGGNQQFDYKTSTSNGNTIFTLAGDDIIVGINFNQEATEIALEELKTLQDKSDGVDFSTLDAQEQTATGGAADYIVTTYSLNNDYKNDPWGKPYLWGDQGNYPSNTNRRYHRFFSQGPDKTRDTDDDLLR